MAQVSLSLVCDKKSTFIIKRLQNRDQVLTFLMLDSMGCDSYIVYTLIHCLVLLPSCVRFRNVVLAEKDG